MRTQHEVQALLRRVLSRVTAPEATVGYSAIRSLTTRFAENTITQNRNGEEEELQLTVAYGTRQGSSLINSVDDASLDRLVSRAESIARVAPKDPEHVCPLGAQRYPATPPHLDEQVPAIEPEALAAQVRSIVGVARASGYVASGFAGATVRLTSLATSAGLFAFDAGSRVELSTTMHGPQGSGYAAETSWAVRDVMAEEIAHRALATAYAAQNPSAIEPGEYTVILEPRAVADLLGFVAMNLGAREAEEGSTAFAGRLGTRLMSERFTLSTQIDDPRLPASPFSDDGLPSRPIVWIERGVPRRLHHTRCWARVKGEEADPSPFPLCVAGGDLSVDDLIARCPRGLLVKRLWYIRYVDRKDLLLTGMTRDGLFMIEDGRIAGPVKNLRFNESPLVAFKNIIGLSRPHYVDGRMRVPAVMCEGFSFSSTTESV